MRSDRWPRPIRRFLAARRRARFRFLVSQVDTWDGMRVIDLGCGREGRSTTALAPPTWEIVGVDREPGRRVRHRHPRFTYRCGDVRDLSAFEDGAFDLAISVGLLEHVTEPEAFAAAASEIQRVARQYALVVPSRYAWIEPHYFVPFFPVLPRRLQNALVRAFNLHGQAERVAADPHFVDHRVVWRSNAEYRAAFPGSRTVLTPTKETVAIVKSRASRASRGSRGAPDAPHAASRRKTQHAIADRFGILPTVATILRARLDAAIAEAERRRPGAVAALDAGCGRRSPLVPFRARLRRVVGVDVHVPQPPIAGLDEFVTADLCSESPLLERDAFDVVLSNFTLEHFSDPKAAIANLHRTLRPGGRLVVTTVNRRNPFVGAYLAMPSRLQERLQPIVKRPGATAHRLVGKCNDPRSIRAVLTEVGFEAITLEAVANLARSWGPRWSTYLVGLFGDIATQPRPSRRSTIIAVARKPLRAGDHPGSS